LLPRSAMAIMATESATSSKKPGSDESRSRGAGAAPEQPPVREGETSKTRPGVPPSARPGEVGKDSSDKASHKAPKAEPENVDDDLEDPYDNVACTD
jgi:hypothetical protein